MVDAHTHPNVLPLAVAFELGLVAVAAILGWLVGAPPFEQARLTVSALLVGAAATAPPLAVMWWCCRSPWPPFRRLVRELDATVRPLFARCSPAALALIAAAAGIGEEALFRGVLQTAFGTATTPVIGLIVASVLFGVVHLVTPTYAVLATLVGVYLGGLLIVFQNLTVVITTHALYDLLALLYWTRSTSPTPPISPDDLG